MSSAVKRVVFISAGVVLGMALVAIGGAWRDHAARIDATPTPAPPVHAAPAPGTRV